MVIVKYYQINFIPESDCFIRCRDLDSVWFIKGTFALCSQHILPNSILELRQRVETGHLLILFMSSHLIFIVTALFH